MATAKNINFSVSIPAASKWGADRRSAKFFSRTYRRKAGKKSVYWYYVTDEHGKRLRFSLGTSSKTEARFLLNERLKAGELAPRRIRPTRFDAFTEHFWDWERCTYLKWKRLRGDRISRHWSRQNRRYLVTIPDYITPPLFRTTSPYKVIVIEYTTIAMYFLVVQLLV